MNRKGIILAGGTGKRLYPVTRAINKQLLPIYNKPMIFYPLTTLMLAGIRDILIITNTNEIETFKTLLGDGSHLGVKILYKEQKKAMGVAHAFLVGAEFIGNDQVTLILGDNIFYGNRLIPLISNENQKLNLGAKIFVQKVKNPKQFGVVEFDQRNRVIGIEEKPNKPKSNYAITGLYFYDNSVFKKAENVKLSKRGEYEISDINLQYLKENSLEVEVMNRGIAWLDTGTYENMYEASGFIQALENIQGLKIGCPEEVAWRLGLISDTQLTNLGESYLGSEYGEYLLKLIENQK